MKTLKDEIFVRRGLKIFSADIVDSWGNPAEIARIHEQQFATRERQLVALLENAPRMLRLLSEIKHTCFPMYKENNVLFDEIDALIAEIEKAGEAENDRP